VIGMDKRHVLKLTAVAIVSVMTVLFAMLLLSEMIDAYRGTSITLPEAYASTTASDVRNRTEEAGEVYERVSVNPENVAEVIATLTRPAAYTHSALVELRDGGIISTAQVFHAVRGDVSAAVRYTDGSETHAVRTGETVYLWGTGADLTQYPVGDFSADALAGFPTYEVVCTLDASSVTAAAYTLYEGFSCIFFTTYDAELGLTCDYYVDIASGLLVYSETRRAGEVIYSLQTLSIVRDTPSDEYFRLPDGRVAGTF